MTEPVYSEEIFELEMAAMTVLRANKSGYETYADFRTAFSDHLKTAYRFDQVKLDDALVDLDRGSIKLPRGIKFSAPGK